MSTTQTYQGGCHCGKIRYEVTTSLEQVISCNCSICSKKGMLLTFTGAEQFKLLSGEGELTDYQFNKHRIHHLFCRICGAQSFATGTKPDGKPSYAVNIRCLDDVDVSGLKLQQVDGKSF